MRRTLAVLLAVLTAASVVGAAYQAYSTTVSATQTNSAVAFGFTAKQVLVINDGSNEVFIDLTDTTAVADTTDSTNVEIKAGSAISFAWDARTDPTLDGWTGMGVICSSGETATVRVTATR